MYLADCNRVGTIKCRLKAVRTVSFHLSVRIAHDMFLAYRRAGFSGTPRDSRIISEDFTHLSPKAKFCPNNIRMKHFYCSTSSYYHRMFKFSIRFCSLFCGSVWSRTPVITDPQNKKRNREYKTKLPALFIDAGSLNLSIIWITTYIYSTTNYNFRQ